MKYMILGLGNFGASLATKLTAQGNEVIGIDNRMDRVDMYKEKISHTICLDTTDQFTVEGLPLKDTDVVIVAIGENQGANVMTTALFKNLGAKKLISRAIDKLHQQVLEAIGVDEIVHPEEETAERWAKKLCLKNIEDSFELSDDFSIIEARVPEKYVGKSIIDIGIRENFNLLVLTIIKNQEVKSTLGKTRTERKVMGVASPTAKLESTDIMVLYGNNTDLESFLEKRLNDKA